jgi:hypothetical protein
MRNAQCAIKTEREDQSSLNWCRELEKERGLTLVAEGGCAGECVGSIKG